MTVHASFYAQAQYQPSDLMQRDADWIAPGVMTSTDLQVTAQSPAALAVNVAGAPASSPGGNAWLVGGYRLNNDSQLALTIVAADPTNPRIDLIVAGVNTTTNPYTPEVKVITGTAAATPVAPVTPAGYLSLAQIAVAAGATSISQANITDERVLASLQGSGAGLTGVVLSTKVGAANGVAPLDANAKVPATNLPAMNYIPTSAEGVANGVATLDATGNVPASELGNVPPVHAATGSALGTVELPLSAGAPTTPVVAYRAVSVQEHELVDTNLDTVLTFTPATAGNFIVAASVRVAGAANVTVTLQITWTDAGGAQTETRLNAVSLAPGTHDVPIKFINALGADPVNVDVQAGTANEVFVSASIVGV